MGQPQILVSIKLCNQTKKYLFIYFNLFKLGYWFEKDTWSARQVLGKPNVYPKYGDLEYTWAQDQGNLDSLQFIEVEFQTEVFASQINIYETCHAGAVIRIKLLNKESNQWTTAWQSQNGPQNIESSRVFSPPLTMSTFKTNSVRLELDCSTCQSYCEIDAIGKARFSFCFNL